MTAPVMTFDGREVLVEAPPVPTLHLEPPTVGEVLVLPVAGPPGQPGTGGGGGAPTYTHVQVTPAAVWVVDHGLQRRPVAWSLDDAQGRPRDEFVVEHPTVNRAVVRMDVATAGTIYLI